MTTVAGDLRDAIETHQHDVLAALIQRGCDIEQVDAFDTTPLMTAAEADNVPAIDLLLAAGARVDREKGFRQTALSVAAGRASARRLLDAGADPSYLSREGMRLLLGFSADPDAALLDCSSDDYLAMGKPRFAAANGQEITHPYYRAMIRSGLSAYSARKQLTPAPRKGEKTRPFGSTPTWCAERFGQSISFLPDGRIVQIGGEHEDSYDSDFCIYNDVFVHHPDGRIQVFGYPESVFPPTDFHTATLVGDYIYIVGTLGYQGTRRADTTPVHRLNLSTMRIEAVKTAGTPPGWLHRHRADLLPDGTIAVSGGTVLATQDSELAYNPNLDRFILNLRNGTWSLTTP